MIPDLPQRQQALDPLQSFCVTAPAGSGKTELLIQRYLTLLARAQAPEQVLAITFTRKAALEMQTRVSAALKRAINPEPPGDDHAQLTWQLATEVLKQDREQNWHLLHNPARLNIKTIDSFCAALARQLPVLSGIGGSPMITDDADFLYQKACRNLLSSLERDSDPQSPLRQLLLLLDNNWFQLEPLLMRLLARRDQWLTHIGTGLEPLAAEEALTAAVAAEIEAGLKVLHQSLGADIGELVSLLNYSAGHTGAPGSRLETDASALPHWRRLIDLLLTGTDDWRSQITVRQGFPAGKGEPGDWKARWKEALGSLKGRPGLRRMLMDIRTLPVIDPEMSAWQQVISLSQLLPLLAAHLSLVFAETGAMDYSQVSIAAREALGEDDNPTDLALKLDHTLRHILLDEFQDTSISQFELVRRLTRGWLEENQVNPGSPRTFFIVGDGMQSIYGFREADVSLFIRARDQGFNGLRPTALQLTSNFRSAPALVDWVNESVGPMFPEEDNESLGEISFAKAEPVLPQHDDAKVQCLAFVGEPVAAARQQAVALADHIAAAEADPNCTSIAVLVKARSHLQPIIHELKQRGICWRSQDIESLSSSPAIIDLLTLCKALHHFSDRVSWLAILRAPWCGVQLADLQALLSGHSKESVWFVLNHTDWSQRVSADAVPRLSHMVETLRWALQWLDRMPLRALLEQLWLRLRGRDCLQADHEQSDVDDFLELVELQQQGVENFKPRQLEQAVSSLYAGGSAEHCKLELMTLHRAKGLEFDWVIIPDLARPGRPDQRELLLWDRTHRADSGAMLIAIDDPALKKQATLYNYLRHRRTQKNKLELTRLLYVGTTRARQRLILTSTLAPDQEAPGYKPPQKRTLLDSLWPTFEAQMQITAVEDVQLTEYVAATPALRRLPLPAFTDAAAHAPEELQTGTAAAELEDMNRAQAATGYQERSIGTTVHALLEHLSRSNEAVLGTIKPDALVPRIRQQLTAMHLVGSDLDTAIDQVQDSLQQVLADPSGRWLLSSEREEAVSEYSISSLGKDGRLREMIVDRSFVVDNTRWIIDYKNARPLESESTDAFIHRQHTLYAQQLQMYREGFNAIEDRPIKIALYFTALGMISEVKDRV